MPSSAPRYSRVPGAPRGPRGARPRESRRDTRVAIQDEPTPRVEPSSPDSGRTLRQSKASMDRWSDDVEAKPSQPFVAVGGAVSRESMPTSMASSTYHSSGAKSPLGDETPARSRARTTLVGLDPSMAEPDDYLHIPDKNPNKHSYAPSWRGIINVLTLLVITLALIMLFAGYPILANVRSTYDKVDPYHGARKGKIPQVAHRPLIDVETPANAKTFSSPTTNRDYDLVFSDEFNTPGRTFWPGDDPYWEALDAWYRGTQDYEWYTPEAVNTTTDPDLNATFLQITLEHVAENQLNFRSGMLMSWNKVCFQGGYFEVSSILPGGPSTAGYWPAAWLMGNLGRPGYLATTDGMWPYVYQGCDVGILENQTYPNGTGPHAALHANSMMAKNAQISKLPGMRASACTCPGEDHPGPRNNVARGVPEIDIFEAQVQGKHTQVSQSYQVAPFDHDYKWGEDLAHIFDKSITQVNKYHGGDTQEAVSCVSQVPDSMFWNTDRRFTKLGLEYEPDWNGPGSGSVTFYMDGKPTWSVNGSSLRPDPQTGIGQRTFPLEPMMMILNLGISSGFQTVDWDPDTGVDFPAKIAFDYVRVYQPKNHKSVTCDPDNYPTAKYIQKHADIYNDRNITNFNKKPPKNKYTGC